jgi:hypothetical protein
VKYFRVIRLVYIKNPVINYPGQWTGQISELLSEVVSEKNTWAEAYEEFRRHIWAVKRGRIKMPIDMAMEIIVHGYVSKHKSKNPFNLSDRIIKEREWLVMGGSHD